jgi:hypothetical protein
MRRRILMRSLFLGPALLAVVGAGGIGRAQQKAAAVLRVARPVQVWPDEQFDQWVFNGNAAAGRQRLDAMVALNIEDIERAGQLTEAQKKKMQLAGRGDVKRLFDGYESAKRKFRLLGNDVQKLQDVMPDVGPLQTALRGGSFLDNSILAKSLPHTLTAEQLGKYDMVVTERRALRHRANIEMAVMMLEDSAPLRDAQRQALITLLTTETKPPRKSASYDYYVTIIQIGHVPEEKLKPLFTDPQWKAASRIINQYRGYEKVWKENGILPGDDEAGVPAAPEK